AARAARPGHRVRSRGGPQASLPDGRAAAAAPAGWLVHELVSHRRISSIRRGDAFAGIDRHAAALPSPLSIDPATINRCKCVALPTLSCPDAHCRIPMLIDDGPRTTDNLQFR